VFGVSSNPHVVYLSLDAVGLEPALTEGELEQRAHQQQQQQQLAYRSNRVEMEEVIEAQLIHSISIAGMKQRIMPLPC
jgi:hypothetical protein